ncbi:Uncharacterised protein [Pandoraea pulmonicola]|uniref:Uncharacterized protein n=1 Tax=Pandoraea pulmonicola TaxID=93221 RepID=A0AAJ5D148_PANPU|nr:Uncharacterised protein [Pandoraea pulmonicola]
MMPSRRAATAAALELVRSPEMSHAIVMSKPLPSHVSGAR